MCNPMVIPLVISLVGAAVSAKGQMDQAKAANAQADFQSKVAVNNAATAEMEAKYAEQQGERNAEAQRRRTAVMIGAQRAKMGASGAVVDAGSFLDLTLDTAKQGELDAMALLEEGQLEAWRARIQGGNFQAQSKLYGMSKTNPYIGAAGTLLQGAGQAGMGYMSMSGGGSSGFNVGGARGTSTGTGGGFNMGGRRVSGL
jgi:hypothetical protein